AKKAIVVVPVILEIAEVEPEIANRVGKHGRNPEVAVVVPARFLLIERGVPLTFRQTGLALLKCERCTLRADEGTILRADLVEAFVGTYRLTAPDTEHLHLELPAGNEFRRRLAVIRVSDVRIVVVEFRFVRRFERVE